ncbi:hypothetical protein [Streptomyces sp. CL12]|uniref:hypothetical protein n=1 Tax=Streptomyces sp. CL12 TaxID=3391744 RepID=UPI003A80BF30
MTATVPGASAENYWKAVCLLSFSHAAGLDWPPPGRPQRARAAGHWGCNPGLAWIAGHLAETCADREFLMVVGTGHATSFCFAHAALRTEPSAGLISEANRTYSQPGGQPSELIGEPDVPYVGGELGPALGVGQGLAAARPGLRVATVVGDGECETPVALAALVHRGELLRAGLGAVWLPVVNANGARMGAEAALQPERLSRLLGGLGYEVVISGTDNPEYASMAAGRAWRLAEEGAPVVWISCSDKGWPAPEEFAGTRFRGSHAHKPTALKLSEPEVVEQVTLWIDELNTPPLFGEDGRAVPEVAALARRVRLDLPGGPRKKVRLAHVSSGTSFRSEVATAMASPMEAADELLAEREIRVFSPDEASSNRLSRCLADGLVTEVLAEELCSAWAWGYTEAGRPAAVVSYEAFAPLIATQVSQYLKILRTRPPAGRPPLLVVLSSLGWANSPTHQNTDFVAGLLARAPGPVRAVFPVGATSVRRRLAELADGDGDAVHAVTCSKQVLPDLMDPGGAAIEFTTTTRQNGHDGTLIAVGDIAVVESVAAMRIAETHGIALRVIALVDLTLLDTRPESALREACAGPQPTVCASWVAPHHLAAVYGRVRPEPAQHVGYQERWGAVARGTLHANGLTRWCLLDALAGAGCVLPTALLDEVRDARSADLDGTAPTPVDGEAPTRLRARSLGSLKEPGETRHQAGASLVVQRSNAEEIR